jgi:hypothetical protein
MSKIVKLSDKFFLDLHDLSAFRPKLSRLRLKSTGENIYLLTEEENNELIKILNKEIEVRKAEERTSPFRLEPIEFQACKDCGKKIPIIPQQRGAEVKCNPCYEKELEDKKPKFKVISPKIHPTLETPLDKKCITCERKFWVGAAVSDKCMPCELGEDKEEKELKTIKTTTFNTKPEEMFNDIVIKCDICKKELSSNFFMDEHGQKCNECHNIAIMKGWKYGERCPTCGERPDKHC